MTEEVVWRWMGGATRLASGGMIERARRGKKSERASERAEGREKEKEEEEEEDTDTPMLARAKTH